MPTPWTELRALANPIARLFGYYTAYPLDPNEYLGTADLTLDSALSILWRYGYQPQWLSAAKRHPETNRLHDASYRRVPNEHPKAAAGRRLVTDFEPKQCQFHVHLFELEDGVEFYSHYEARPDFVRPDISLGRLRTHYRPQWGETYLQGVTDLELDKGFK